MCPSGGQLWAAAITLARTSSFSLALLPIERASHVVSGVGYVEFERPLPCLTDRSGHASFQQTASACTEISYTRCRRLQGSRGRPPRGPPAAVSWISET